MTDKKGRPFLPLPESMRTLPAMAKPVIALPVIAFALMGADAPTGGEPGVQAFVLNNIYLSSGGEQDACPVQDVGDLDRFHAMLTPDEQAKYAGKENRQALERRMNEFFNFRRIFLRGERASSVKFPADYDPKAEPTQDLAKAVGALNGLPKGAGRLAFQKREVVYSACSNPRDFPALAKGFRTYDGTVGAGMNLDGKTGPLDFTGPDGSKGIDNRLWRAVGCVSAFRESSKDAPTASMSARAPTLIEVRGAESLQDDPEVYVTIVAVREALARDGRGSPLAGASFTPEADSRLRATVKGRIVGGELTTDPLDMILNYKEQIIDAPRHFRGARLRARFGPGGAIKGSIYGYYTLDSYYDSVEQMTQNGANLSRVSCPGVRAAIDRLADGYRDPRTGRFTAISSAYDFVGVRAFLTPPDDGAKTGSLR